MVLIGLPLLRHGCHKFSGVTLIHAYVGGVVGFGIPDSVFDCVGIEFYADDFFTAVRSNDADGTYAAVGIQDLTFDETLKDTTIYTLNGVKVSRMQGAGVYIVRETYADNSVKTRKVLWR